MQRLIVTHPNLMTEKQEFKSWMCLICGFIYSEAEGLPEEGIPAGTRWEDGQRIRLAHDDRHEHIRVRRGRCLPCRKTFTILPDWLAPFGHYSLRCRQQTCERIAAGVAVEQAAPDCLDVTRSPDATTVRRWAQRRAVSIWRWFRVLSGRRLLPLPTIFAWDLTALCRMLPFEARSP